MLNIVCNIDMLLVFFSHLKVAQSLAPELIRNETKISFLFVNPHLNFELIFLLSKQAEKSVFRIWLPDVDTNAKYSWRAIYRASFAQFSDKR
jgi:hypothetical protein